MYKILLFLFLSFIFLNAQEVRSDLEELKRITVTEQLGTIIPLDLEVVDENGIKAKLKDYINGEYPIIFSFAYYECPMLCTQVLSAMAASVKRMDWEAEKKYKVITLSIDARETAQVANKKKLFYLKDIEDESVRENWSFLTAPQSTIDTLTKSLGFGYYYVEERDEFAHPAVVFILSPEGKVSRYLYGLNYEPKDLKFSLLEASDGKIGTTMEKLLLYCYHYDSIANTYVLFAWNLMRLGGVLTMILLFSFLGVYWMREIKKRKSVIVKN